MDMDDLVVISQFINDMYDEKKIETIQEAEIVYPEA
jgi:hypothetical protein